ncbi:MAG: DUF2085 domain-containing protein [Clostridia bacterium]|nr:DUF2085 domain-containing protein [Clostridia bacterium]
MPAEDTKNKIRRHNVLRRLYCRFVIWGHRAGCHQRADRSFFYKGYQFPVCARCTGVLIGYIIALPLYFWFSFDIKQCLFCCMIMFLDWFIQFEKIKESTNIRRLITGILGGAGVFGIQILVIEHLVVAIKNALSF